MKPGAASVTQPGPEERRISWQQQSCPNTNRRIRFRRGREEFPRFRKCQPAQRPLSDPRFLDGKSRHPTAAVFVAELNRTIGAQPLSYWKTLLDSANLPYGVVQIPEEMVNSCTPTRSSFPSRTVVVKGNSRLTVRSQSRSNPRLHPKWLSGLGEQTDDVLHELGFEASQIKSLRTDGVVPPKFRRVSSAAD